MDPMLFDGWQPLARTALVGVLAYAGLVILLRMSGARTLAKMNAFDLVVTVALGSTLATILLSKDVSLAQGLLAFALLVAMQFAVTWSSVRLPWVRRVVTGEPVLLVHRGALLEDAMRRARVNEDDLRAAVRAAGTGGVARAHAVVLETDGTFSVIPADADGADDAALTGVPQAGRDRERDGTALPRASTHG
ncbi:DUF421 domain-containing protein [Coralloluteibacterium stylophorae]|uniref:DUF421 domain-containing protein n=1 Tax=Coralloluteibacterium stylophorae TaxID=1776034 RepID=A0A8J7VWG1_9GAMM|nr:YetF domain-containing protein [Coralloluteibacterium stylophorae]MBS7455606.1 DUF421 domain-containing protein [Coralloluteibacterium stylophorae]